MQLETDFGENRHGLGLGRKCLKGFGFFGAGARNASVVTAIGFGYFGAARGFAMRSFPLKVQT